MKKRIAAIILASGSGARIGSKIPKQFLKLGGRPVLEHTLRAFTRCGPDVVGKVIVVGNPLFMKETKEIASQVNDPRITTVAGDLFRRQGSSFIGLQACSSATHVIIHDGVRPLISSELIRRVAEELDRSDAIDVCIPSSDTIIVKSEDTIREIPDRSDMMLGQTPQAFLRSLIVKAHEEALSAGIHDSTDDCGLIVRLGLPVKIVVGERTNMKITHLDDLYLVERLFQVARLGDSASNNSNELKVDPVLLLGGTRGLGQNLAQFLIQRGIGTTVVSRSTVPSLDVSSSGSIINFLDHIRRSGRKFRSAVYAPGLLIAKSISNYTEKEWEDTFAVNLKGVFLLLQNLDTFLEPGGHFLVFGSSSYSLGRAGYAAYSSSKAALVNLIQAAADEYPQYRLNVVSPQRANTELRINAFGAESSTKLLSPDVISERLFHVMNTDATGMNFDVRIDAPLIPKSPATSAPHVHREFRSSRFIGGRNVS